MGHIYEHFPNSVSLFAGGEKGIDEYYRQQEEMLESFVEMDSIAERGHMPSSTQVSPARHLLFSALSQTYY